ncbi:MAG: ORF6N domain-containing protein [Muribaculaceae bacterium]|nr:ORF6N domain-containing protein [Muribaculaceae bacterium]
MKENNSLPPVPLSESTDADMMPIENLIHIIRGQQVMLDSDLARLYGVETRRLNEQVKRNIDRFPEDFMFQLTKEDVGNLMSQIATSSLGSQFATLNKSIEDHKHQETGTHNWGGTRKLPFVFTENGVAMLSSVLRSKTAIDVNIRIMRAFTAMRSFMISNAHLFSRIETLEHNHLLMNSHLSATDRKIDEVLTRLDNGNHQPLHGILFDGRIFDAYVFICDLIESARDRIILIDNYADYSSLKQLDKRASGVSAIVYTSDKNKSIKDDIKRHDAQYPSIEVRYYQNVHDRFLIIDESVYLVGGSFKDLGKKLVGFAKMESVSPNELMHGIKTKK